ncbi:hypothetical protein JJD26997_1107 [Campylobacter jejuni subsp. doylei 269.97]|uniref:Uncharacterized protein n=2 Tax=Campylobacter jejuni subsp. doylei TaxID=32021 RepID=A7H3W2_CAMJD|nr:hypothetical protein JJD26997_1107 [Campylobacter jejuni subsp. doylei 269.97]AVL47430.1 hypothetical protein CEP74_06515 [Campylobacter jejuni subsp. doylei]
MKITEFGKDIGIIFDNGNTLCDYHEQECYEYNYADWCQLKKSALNYDFNEETFKIIPNYYGFKFGDKNRTFSMPCYYGDYITIFYRDKYNNVLSKIDIKGE